MQKSLDDENGRSISLWPHGILFRDAEMEMRKRMIKQDVVECVIGLGPNLFYNSPMEACLLITNNNKPADRKGKILFINAVKEVKQEKTMAFLEEKHIIRIFNAYKNYKDENNFAAVKSIDNVMENKGNMAISLYVQPNESIDGNQTSFGEVYQDWENSSDELKKSMSDLFQILDK